MCLNYTKQFILEFEKLNEYEEVYKKGSTYENK